MDDTIYRQAAIDALAKHEKSKGHNYTLFVDIVSECAEIIRDLPSAEPTQTNVSNTLNALDCISRQDAIDGADEIIKRDTSGNNAVVEAMKAWKVYIGNLPSTEPRWIPVTERLPDDETDIFVTYVDGEETRIVPVNYGRDTWFDCIFDRELNPHMVTAWMPLPKAYKGGEE